MNLSLATSSFVSPDKSLPWFSVDIFLSLLKSIISLKYLKLKSNRHLAHSIRVSTSTGGGHVANGIYSKRVVLGGIWNTVSSRWERMVICIYFKVLFIQCEISNDDNNLISM